MVFLKIKTGAYGVPSKSKNPIIIFGTGGPSSAQSSNPSWAFSWHHPFGNNNYPPHFDTVHKTKHSFSHWIFYFLLK
jgi:hypothetical protein